MKNLPVVCFLFIPLCIGGIIEDCPNGCTCKGLLCSTEKNRNYCKEVEVLCENANVIRQLELLPVSATRIRITGEDMGKNTLDIFARFTGLKKLNLTGNVIRRLDISKPLESLDYLNLNDNLLCLLPLRNLSLIPRLQKLRVQGNNLTYIHDIRFPTRIVDLDLSHNNIQTPRKGSFRRMKRLRYLNLQNNSIAALNPLVFRHLVNLEILELDYNQITQLGPNSFKLLPNVWLVSLKYNFIDRIDRHAFKQLGVRWHGVHQIRLEYNRITILEEESIRILYPRKEIYAIYLTGNPLYCDCEILSVREKYGSLLSDADEATCHEPSYVNGTTIADFETSDCDDYYDFYYDDDDE